MFKWPIWVLSLGTGLILGAFYANKKTRPVFDHIFEESKKEGFFEFKRKLNNDSVSFVQEYSKHFDIKESLVPKGLLSNPEDPNSRFVIVRFELNPNTNPKDISGLLFAKVDSTFGYLCSLSLNKHPVATATMKQESFKDLELSHEYILVARVKEQKGRSLMCEAQVLN